MFNANTRVADLVSHDFRVAVIFRKYGIDYCSGASQPLTAFCQERQVEPDRILAEIDRYLRDEDTKSETCNKWTSTKLADYIEDENHPFIEQNIEDLNYFLARVVEKYGDRQPALFEIRKRFQEMSGEFTLHMRKEELFLFPYIKRLDTAFHRNSAVNRPNFGTVMILVGNLEEEHREAARCMEKIRELTNNYELPDFACTTYQVAFQMLENFEANLQRHLHLENNILFPRSIVMERLVFAMNKA